MFKKSLCFMSICALMLTLSCSSQKSSQSTWKLALEEIEGSVQDHAAQVFKKEIGKSMPKTKVQVFPYGALGTSDQLTELVRGGVIQMAMASPGHLGKLIPEAQVFLLHFLFSDNDELNYKVLKEGKVVSYFDKRYQEKGMKLLAFLPEGWMVWSANKALDKTENFKGLKIRVMTSPLLVEAYRSYGANPTPMAYSEVYSALQIKMIDAQVNPIFAIEEMSFYEVNPVLTVGKHSMFVTSLVMNLKTYNSLSDKQKQDLHAAVDVTQKVNFEFQAKLNQDRLEKMKKKKPDLKVVNLNDESRAAYKKLSQAMRDQFVKTVGENGQKVIDLIESDLKELSQK